MYLKSLEISGFKSFAKKDILEYTTPITAIVGPNGSGKSNIAEAFRFVLGEQSFKSMRGKKGEDLIFDGTTNAARANRASVKITLDNQKKIFPIDYDEITVERVVHRDGSNEYLINGSRTRLKDVQELLAAANIGPTGHHIISQGEADRILSASPKDRREMIEDALGLKVYQYKKQESEKKLAKTQENIAQVQSLRKEVQPHLRFLERQVKKIEKSLELKEKLNTFYKEYLKREDTYIKYHHERLTKEKKEPEAELATLSDELKKAREVLQSEEQDEKRDALVSLEEKLQKLRERRQEVLRESGRIEGQVSYLERALEDRRAKAEKEASAPIPFDDVKQVVESIEQKAKGASRDEQSLKHIVDDILRTLRSFLNEVSRSSERDAYDGKEEEELVALKKEKHSQEEKLRAIEKEEAELKNEYDELKRSIESEVSESREAEREVFRIMGRQRELESTVSQIDQKLAELERDREEFKRELQEAVALIGREANGYESYTIKKDDAEISHEDIVNEKREEQRERRRELEKMKIRLEELGGGGTDEVMKEYKEVKERDEFLEREISDLEESVQSLEELITDLNKQLNEKFVTGIDKIDAEFNTFFTLMFGGGSASLKRVKPKVKKQKKEENDLEGVEGFESSTEEEDEEDEKAQEGIEIDVKLPNKKVRGLDMLSGGERALTSIALIFAMSQVNPPLFLILDETDAALDEANSKRYGDMIESLAEKSQLILITHNRETMSRAGVLYGVTMGADGVSKLISVKFDDALAVAK